MTTATQLQHNTTPVLYVAFELSKKTWKLAISRSLEQRPRTVNVTSKDEEGLKRAIDLAAKKLDLHGVYRIKSLYEAGRDGIWIHRFLAELKFENRIVDSSSIEVNRRKRRAKTDRLDALSLVKLLIRYDLGDLCLRVNRVPDEETEDLRHLMRGRESLVRERADITNRMKALAALQGVELSFNPGTKLDFEEIRIWNGDPLPRVLRRRLELEWDRYRLLTEQIKELKKMAKELLKSDPRPAFEIARRLVRINGIGVITALTLSLEIFSWRGIRNRKELAALVGLSPTPHASGDFFRDQGISKAGNRRLRALLIEIAWMWLRHQPEHAATLWFHGRFAVGGRMRRVGIVGVARRMLITLWHVSKTDELPERESLLAA